MVGLHAFKSIEIESHRGPYPVLFVEDVFDRLRGLTSRSAHFVVDAKVMQLYQQEMEGIRSSQSCLLIDATEANKSLERFSDYVEQLILKGIRRDHCLVAVGGGIIQDIVCFLATILFRGMTWVYYPTTLLAQADSCIGSKSSINVGSIKNVVGTFTPPHGVFIGMKFLNTLEHKELCSGLGEMLKVHAIEGPLAFDEIARDYEQMFKDRHVMRGYIDRSLRIKKRFIEQDEFDRGVRNIMNYGHSFGHAIESATDFGIPHGVAVSMGMDMANFISVRLGVMGENHFSRMHSVLRMNYHEFSDFEIPFDLFMKALERDKKNTSNGFTLILPDEAACIAKRSVPNDAYFQKICFEYFAQVRS